MCHKRKFDKIGVMFALSQTKRQANYNHNRQEKRYYYCSECNAWHLTSHDKKINKC